MKEQPFVGRVHELARLGELHAGHALTLVVVKGRRRVGKSRLVAELAAKKAQHKLWGFSGLAPQSGLTAQSQRDHFAHQLAAYLQLPPLTFHDWSDAFAHLSLQVKSGDIVLLDEISWMGAKDPSFIPKLKAWWDEQTTPMMLVFCGSVSIWIEENILNNTAFFGRINLTITLEPLAIPESMVLLKAVGFQGSAYDAYRLLAVMGGVPWYLQQVRPGVVADQIIKQLCFEKNGLLVLEFDRTFHDLFNGKGALYKKILAALKNGMKSLNDIRRAIEFTASGTLSQMMAHLIVAGFVTKHGLWAFKTTKPLKQSLYRISDPYLRFYLKVIEPQRNKIDAGHLHDMTLSQLPGFDAHMGLQLEHLLLQNRPLLLSALGVVPGDVVADGPYRQSKTTTRAGCQVDYLVQTYTNNIFVCEFKFKRRELGVEVVEAMQAKVNALKVPKGFAVVPVLFHMGGVTPSVETSGYFYRIVDIAEFLSG